MRASTKWKSRNCKSDGMWKSGFPKDKALERVDKKCGHFIEKGMMIRVNAYDFFFKIFSFFIFTIHIYILNTYSATYFTFKWCHVYGTGYSMYSVRAIYNNKWLICRHGKYKYYDGLSAMMTMMHKQTIANIRVLYT